MVGRAHLGHGRGRRRVTLAAAAAGAWFAALIAANIAADKYAAKFHQDN
jgi:uncharacterized protein YcfJ